MRTSKSWLFLIVVLLSFYLSSSAQSVPPPQAKYVPGRLLVRFRPATRPLAIKMAHRALAADVVKNYKSVEGLQLVKLSASTKLSAALAAYRANPDVVYAEPDYIVHSFQAPNDPLFPQMWSLLNTGQSNGTLGADIKATQAWDLTTGSSSVIVAVIDTGVDYNHPDLAANIFTGAICPGGVVCHGINALTGAANPNDPFDDNGHGTHVSGTIGALGNNALGVTGVNWNVTILPCKFLNFDGVGSVGDAIKCLDFIKGLKDTQGLNIVASNNSWGSAEFSQALQDAIDRQRQSGILFIAAAGNNFQNNDVQPVYPASYPLPNIISVAATDRNDNRAFFSDVGFRTVHIGAPGEDILSTLPGGAYGVESGTSMAAPHVTGVAVLLAAQDPTRGWPAIKNLILAGGDPDPDLSATVSGRRLNAFSSLTCLNSAVSGRLAPVTDVVSGSVGVPLTLSALNISCAQPAGAVQVTVSPGGQSIPLTDDGVAPDIAAADGVYTGSFTPPASGVYTLSFGAGDSVTVQVLNNYQASDAAFSYRNIVGTNLNLGDDDVAQITSPFPISFGDGSFSQLWISANGTISFSGAFSSYVHEFIPTGAPDALSHIPASTLVAPFWDDLLPTPGSAQNVFWDVTGTAPNRELVVEWRDVQAFDCAAEPDTIRFQAVFFENSSNVLFNYADAVFGGACANHDRGGSASTGIQVAPLLGALWGRNGQFVNDGMAVLWQTFTTPPPAPATPTVTSISPAVVDAYGPDFILTINGSNFQPGARAVMIGGFDRVTTFVSSTQLTALIPASNIDLFQFFSNSTFVGVRNPGTLITVVDPSFPKLTINNPSAPVITGFNPASVPGNGLSFLLDINGNDFSPSSTVTWNGQLLRFSRAASRTHIVAVVPGPFAVQGTAQVQVVNPLPGGGSSPVASYLVGPPGPATNFSRTQASIINLHRTGSPDSPAIAGGPSTVPLRFLGWNYARSKGDEYLKQFIRPYAPAFTAGSGTQSSPGQLAGSAPIGAALSGSLPGLAVTGAKPTGFLPTGVAVGDFNRDGHSDYVVCNGGSNDLWIYFGNGDGTFQDPRIIPLTGATPLQVIAADLRGIGILDLIVAEPDSLSVGVLLGAGDGTFGQETLYFSPGPPLSISVADFDGDGHPDVVAGIIGDNNSGPLVFFAGNGSGRLAAPLFTPTSTIFATPFVSARLAMADFDKDGFPDLLVTDCCVGDLSPGVVLYRNLHDGTFKAKPQILFSDPDIGFFYLNTAAGDLNNDTCPDFVANDTHGLATVVLGNCDGTFREGPAPVRFASGDISAAVAMADMNGDGNLDLINSSARLQGFVPGRQSGQLVAISLGDGAGSLSAPHVFRVQTGLFALAVADLNGDLRPDIVAASQDADSVTTLINDGFGGFPGPQGGYVGWAQPGSPFVGVVNAPTAAYVGDLNSDGKPDLFFADFGLAAGLPANVSVALNDGAGGFGKDIKSAILDGGVFFGTMISGDFRNTGKKDLIVVPDQFDPGFSGPFFNFLAGLGDGHFDRPITNTISHSTGTLAAGDFNGDGKLDFVMFGSSEVSTFLGNGDGTFVEAPMQIFPAIPPGAIFVGDVNGDLKLDLLVPLQGQLVEFLGNGDGTFAPGVPVITNASSGSGISSPLLDVVDLNHDGRVDVVLRNPENFAPFQPQFQVYMAQPDGSLFLTNTYAPYSGTAVVPINGQVQFTSSFMGDFNGDGNPDIAAFQTEPLAGSYVQILLGNGDGTFTPTFEKLPLGVRELLLPTLVADFNGDGKADFAELDAFTAAFNVISSTVGHPFSLQFSSLPVVGLAGSVHIGLSVPSLQDTTLQLSSSEPAITLPVSVTVPAGSLGADVDFSVGAAFDASRTFRITATDGLKSSSALGFVAAPGAAVGFIQNLLGPFSALLPGQSSGQLTYFVASRGGYQTTVNLRCDGLPAGVTCQFGNSVLQVPAGRSNGTTLVLAVNAALAIGNYNFSIVASDASISQTLPVTLKIGDFGVQLASTGNPALPTGIETFQLNVSSINNFVGGVGFSCSGLPAGTTCRAGSTTVVGSGFSPLDVAVNTSNVAVGDYPFVITGNSGFTTHSVDAVLHVGDYGASTITPGTATLRVGESATFTLSVDSVNGFNDPTSLFCSPTVNGIGVTGVNCSFTPSPATFDASGKLTAQITVTVAKRPFGGHVPRLTSTTLPPRWYVSLAAVFALAGIFAFSPRRRKAAACLCCIALLAMSAMIACGGGGSAAGNPRPTPAPSPTPAGPQTVNIDVFGTLQTQAQNQARKLASFSVVVP